MKTTHRTALLSSICAMALALSGCVGITLNTQERPLSRAIDDMGTKTDLNARLLAEDPQLFANVSTTVIEGRVHLAGSVASDTDRMKAAELAWSSPGVVEVVNNIEVTDRGGIDDIARDRWLSAQVRARLMSDPSIRDINYSIDTQNSVVFVMGIGQDQGEIDRAMHHARSVPGVRSVVNYVVTKDDPRRMARVAIERGHDRPSRPITFSDDETPAPAYSHGGSDTTGGSYLPEPVEVETLKEPGAHN